jgi:hypothetical protein
LLFLDADGDVDLVLLEREAAAGATAPAATAAIVRIWRNNGDRTFAVLEDALPGRVATLEGSSGAVAIGDFDLGNDIDFAIGSAEGPALVFLNQRRGPFRRLEVEGLRGHELLLAFDADEDGDDDLAGVPSERTPSLRLALNEGLGDDGSPRWRLLEESAHAPAAMARAADLDQDGDTDLLCGGKGGLVLLTNRGDGRFAPARLEVEEEARAELVDLAARDLDGDGLLDVVAVASDGSVRSFRRAPAEGDTARPYDAVTLRLTGSRDNRAGIGAHVELFAGGAYQRVLVEEPGGARFGLGALRREAIEGFTVLWPNGVRQPVLPGDLSWDEHGAARVVQKAGLEVSCPFLYTYDSERFRFLTDVVGIAPLDEWRAPGSAPHLDPQEYVRIPREALAADGGRLRLVITEELRETTYLDAVRLIELFHPRGTLAWCDESTRQGGVEPLRVVLVRPEDLSAPAAVRSGGADGSALVRDADRRYFHAYGGAPSQWAGWVEPFAIEVELPRRSREGGHCAPAALLLTGRIAWQDSGVAYALHQHSRTWAPHRLDLVRRGARGESLETLLADAGFPCGMDRTLVVPLGRLPHDAAALRLVATSRLFWDRIAFASRIHEVVVPDGGKAIARSGDDELRVETETLALLGAELGYHGFSRRVGDVARHEQTYDFAAPSPLRDFPSPAGLATRHGDARELVGAMDDRLAVLVPGDALHLEFAAGRPPRADEEVTYFLKLTGWAKENGFHNTTGRTVEPLPFHGMARYPEDAIRRDGRARAGTGEPEHRRYLTTFQTRRVEPW